ncbi:hypothetical protein [Bradyrhizobium roseum]|uniref:hypothetical protein n=1 Tax=Bradyrhizobium roseum TaxID=3056648 RepID=UPI002639736C|nr:hypothetical protein [Bradyrhizobium roseus]WKA26415.1 hypothetical protein QUH67_22790 [Bradyrhizobium roseus]
MAAIQHQRYAHTKLFKRANRMLEKLRTHLGRVIPAIGRKTEGNGGPEAAFAKFLLLARPASSASKSALPSPSSAARAASSSPM